MNHGHSSSRAIRALLAFVLIAHFLTLMNKSVKPNESVRAQVSHQTFTLQASGFLRLSSHVWWLFWSGYHHEPLHFLAGIVVAVIVIIIVVMLPSRIAGAGTTALGFVSMLRSMFLVVFFFCFGGESLRQPVRAMKTSSRQTQAHLALLLAVRLPSRFRDFAYTVSMQLVGPTDREWWVLPVPVPASQTCASL